MTTDFHEESYRDGVWVGQLIGALMNGCHAMVAHWPERATQEHRDRIEELAMFYGLSAKFEDGSLVIGKRNAPKLTVVQ